MSRRERIRYLRAGVIRAEEALRDTYEAASFTGDLVHGLRHTLRVVAEAKKIIHECGLDDIMAAKLLCSAWLHDIGRVNARDKQHALVSARMTLEILGLCHGISNEDVGDIHFAVLNHSQGLEGVAALTGKELTPASTNTEKLLGFLVLCDHADGVSPEGIARLSEYRQQMGGNDWLPIASAKYTVLTLRRLLLSPRGIPLSEMKTMKEDSVAAHIVYKYCSTAQIMAPMEHHLTVAYRKEWSDRLRLTYSLILTILDGCLD